MTMAEYSMTPLVKKLGIKPGDRVLMVNAPDYFDKRIGGCGGLCHRQRLVRVEVYVPQKK
jgi:hypothetical protein